MHRKVFAVWITLIMIVSSIVILVEIAPIVHAPTTLYVGGAGGGNYSKIQWAIDNASDGDTVFVYNGSYIENVRVDKMITLEGENLTSTIIDGGGSKDTVNITSDFVNITGFTITGSGNEGSYPNYDAGIELYHIQNCNIYNNKLIYNRHGISFTGSKHSRVYDNDASDNYIGFFLGSSLENRIDNNSGYSNDQSGIYLYNSSKNLLADNHLSYNQVAGIYLYLSNSNEVLRCKSINNYGISGHGIIVTSAPNNTIEKCTILSNDANGIYATMAFTYGLTVKDSIISSNDGNAISLSQLSPGNIVSGNTLSDNGYDGIAIGETSEITVENNDIFSNGRHGIHVIDSNSVTIKNNKCGLMIQYGIRLVGSFNNEIYHNDFINNTFQAYDDGINNLWDNGYPNGGNYWSDYNGIDLNSTPTQDVPPPDRIGDTPYVIDGDSADNYPLINSTDSYIFLKQGWNLMSIPFIQVHQEISKVLEMIEGYHDAVQWYDATDLGDSWKHHKIGKPFGNDLSKLNETMSFWIHITNPGDTIFLYNGTTPTSNQTIPLHPGWNMVGYPSLTNHNRTIGLNNLEFGPDVDAVQWYDAATREWHFMGPDDHFSPGRGYWVYSNVEAGWEVPI